MNNPTVLWKNGKIVPWEEGTIHLITPATQYGRGIFEGIRFYDTDCGPAIFRLEGNEEHWARFFYSAEVMGMKLPYSAGELSAAVKQLVKETGLSEGYIRPYCGDDTMGVGVKEGGGHLVVAIAIFPGYKKPNSVRATISRVKRIPPEVIDMKAKISGVYVNSKFAIMDAANRGFDDVILLDLKENVAEGYAANIFAVKSDIRGRKILFTPPRDNILPGITRRTLITLARYSGIEVRERNFKPDFLHVADEAFFCGTAMEVMPISQIDDMPIGAETPGPITRTLAYLYSDAVHGRLPKFSHWLTFVNKYK